MPREGDLESGDVRGIDPIFRRLSLETRGGSPSNVPRGRARRFFGGGGERGDANLIVGFAEAQHEGFERASKAKKVVERVVEGGDAGTATGIGSSRAAFRFGDEQRPVFEDARGGVDVVLEEVGDERGASRDDVERVSSAFEAIVMTRVAVGVAVRDERARGAGEARRLREDEGGGGVDVLGEVARKESLPGGVAGGEARVERAVTHEGRVRDRVGERRRGRGERGRGGREGRVARTRPRGARRRGRPSGPVRVPLGAEPRANRRRGVVERARDVVRRSAVPRDERHHAARPRARQWRYLGRAGPRTTLTRCQTRRGRGSRLRRVRGETEETPRTETPRGETEEKHARSTTSAGSTPRIPVLERVRVHRLVSRVTGTGVGTSSLGRTNRRRRVRAPRRLPHSQRVQHPQEFPRARRQLAPLRDDFLQRVSLPQQRPPRRPRARRSLFPREVHP